MGFISTITENIFSELGSVILVFGFATIFLTGFFPVMAVLFKKMGFGSTPYARQKVETLSLEVLVTTYKEGPETIFKTLDSINAAINRLNNENVKIVILTDPENLETYNAVSSWAKNFSKQAKVIESKNTGKWSAIVKLINNCKSDWCALVDAGTIWDANILEKALPLMAGGKYLGIAPSYVQLKSSVMHRVHWKIEKILKKIENYAGGPCSVHGATVFYDARAAKNAINSLNNSTWYNDDVVIPLHIRTLGSIRYESGLKIYDTDAQHSSGTERNRRQRMMLGNMQWVSKIFPKLFKKNFVLGIIASRRVVRIFWAYSILLTLIIAALYANSYASAAIAIVILILMSLSSSLKVAFIASINSVRYVKNTHGDVTWS